MRRGELRFVNLDPARGAEANKRRPAVIVSNDAANATATRLGHGVVTVASTSSCSPGLSVANPDRYSVIEMIAKGYP